MIAKYLLIFLLGAESLFAGAWTQRKNHYYFRLSGFAFNARAVYDQDGKLNRFAASGEFIDRSAYAYLEYGVSDLVTFVGAAPYKNSRFQSEATINGKALNRRSKGWGDVYLGLRYKKQNKKSLEFLSKPRYFLK